MTQDEFWALISLLDRDQMSSKYDEDGDEDLVCTPLINALSERSEDDIKAFDDILSGLLYELDGQAYAFNAGVCGQYEDLFLYCRCVAVASGREAYHLIAADPAAMPEEMEFEPLITVAERAWFKKTGQEYEHETVFSVEMYANKSNWPD